MPSTRLAVVPPGCVQSVCLASVLALALICSGCDNEKKGPKRSDHQAAHTEHYHPDITRTAPLKGEIARSTESQPATQPVAASGPGPVGTPVLFVNNEPVTVPEILEPILQNLKNDSTKLPPQAYYMAVRRNVREQIDLHVSTLLIHQEAKNNYPEKAMEEFDKEVDRRIKDVVNDRYQGIYARYEAQLKAMDMTMADVKGRIKRQLLVTQYMRDKFKPMLHEPPRRQLYTYYQDHLTDFTTPERAELFLIEVPVDALLGKPRNLSTAQDIADAHSKAVAQLKRAHEELESGVEFTAVARAYSKGIKASQGGAWGEIGPGTLQGRWAKAAEVLFTLAENQTSDVVETEDAAFIVHCGKRTPARQASFEEAQTKIIERMKEEQFNRLTQEYIQGLIAKATIRPVNEFNEAVMAAAPRPPAAPAEQPEQSAAQ
jgi:hypothetical protein